LGRIEKTAAIQWFTNTFQHPRCHPEKEQAVELAMSLVEGSLRPAEQGLWDSGIGISIAHALSCYGSE
jgi:hypothetical protein